MPRDDEEYYLMGQKGDSDRLKLEDWYILMQFGNLEELYMTVFLCSSINSFFLTVKVVKFISTVKIFKVL